jgi:hypothetical protein
VCHTVGVCCGNAQETSHPAVTPSYGMTMMEPFDAGAMFAVMQMDEPGT